MERFYLHSFDLIIIIKYRGNNVRDSNDKWIDNLQQGSTLSQQFKIEFILLKSHLKIRCRQQKWCIVREFNQIIPKMSLPNEKITQLIHDIHNFRLEIERIRNDTQICDGLKNIQISFVQTLISRTYEKIEEERFKPLKITK